jgi:hypothetical protein
MGKHQIEQTISKQKKSAFIYKKTVDERQVD